MNGEAETRARWWLLAALPALALAAWQAAWPWPFFSDDAFVSLRYVERVLGGSGLTWTDGERVEGYSNLLWVLACALLGGLGVELVAAARLLGALCTAFALLLLARAARPHDLRSAAIAAIAPLLVAASQPVLAWTLGGLEGPMVLLWLAWGLGALARIDPGAANTRALVAAGLPFALACWTRPDSPIWVAGVVVALAFAALVGRGASGAGMPASSSGERAAHERGPHDVAPRGRTVTALRRAAAFAALPIAATLLQLAFRLAYYGDLVPNTAHVKAEFDPGAGGAGVDYVRGAFAALPGLTALAVLGVAVLFARPRTRTFALAIALPLVLWSAYLMAIGGDHFPGRRLWHGALAPLALAAGLGLRQLARSSWPRTSTALALGLAAAGWNLAVARGDPQSHEVRAEIWEWRGQVVGEALGRAFAEEEPLLAVDAAGAVPFYARLPALDMLGLCDRTIATTPYRRWLEPLKARGDVPLPPGHLRGNGAYVMERAPDLMLFGPPTGHLLPVFVSACEFEDDPRFLAGYRAVMLDLGPHAIPPGGEREERIEQPLWIRTRGAAGIDERADRIVVPAILFGSFALPQPLRRRYDPPPADPAAAAQLGEAFAAADRWYRSRDAVAVPMAEGDLALELRAGSAAFAWRVPAGAWRATVEPAGAIVQASVAGAPLAPADAGFVLEAETEVSLVLTRPETVAEPLRVRRVVLQRR